jgi:hypothetical protein
MYATNDQLLTRLRNYVACMSPEHRARAGGVLLIEALREIERLNAHPAIKHSGIPAESVVCPACQGATHLTVRP